MSGVIGVALFPKVSGWEQLQRNFSELVDFQRFVPTLADLREDFEQGRLNLARTQVVLVADNMSQGVTTTLDPEGDVQATHLIQAIGNFIKPAADGIEAVPVAIVQTDEREARQLARDVYSYLEFLYGEEEARNAIEAKIRIVHPRLSEVDQFCREMVPSYKPTVAPGDFFVVDNVRSAGAEFSGSPVITVTSAKGGVGKTTTSLLVSFASSYIAHRAGERMNIALVELDLANAQIGHMLGTDPAGPTVTDYVNDGIATESAIMKRMVDIPITNKAGVRILPEGSLRVLHAPVTSQDDKNVRAHHIREAITLLRNSPEIDLVVVDTAPEVRDDERIKAAYEESNLILYLTQDTRASFGIMASSLSTLVDEYRIDPSRIKIVVNNATRSIDDNSLLQDIRSVSNGEIAPLAVIPRSQAILETGGAADPDSQVFHALFSRQDPEIAQAYQSLVGALASTVALDEEDRAYSKGSEADEAPAKKRGLFGIGGK